MKVYEGQSPILDITPKDRGKKGPEQGGGFQGIMEQEKARMEGSGAPAVQGPIQPAGGVEILNPTWGIDGTSGIESKEEVLEELGRTLDLVDFYAGKLADTSRPAEDMNALVERLDERLGHLDSLGKNADLPERLREIVSDVTLTIGTEVARFKRGDYL